MPDTEQELLHLAQAGLDAGDRRLTLQASPFRLAWFPVVPTFVDEMLSSYGVEQPEDGMNEEDIEELREEWQEELEAIRTMLAKIPPERPPDADQRPDYEVRFRQSLDRASLAMTIWDNHGIPYRQKGERIYCLRSPQDLGGQVIINSCEIHDFLLGAARKTAEDAVELDSLRRQVQRWKEVCAVAGGVAVILFLACLT